MSMISLAVYDYTEIPSFYSLHPQTNRTEVKLHPKIIHQLGRLLVKGKHQGNIN